MIGFLKGTAKDKPLGSLQMIFEVWACGQVSQNWEWIGAPWFTTHSPYEWG